MTWLLLLVASFFGGALNSVAGGGSFITFPSLVFGAGLSELAANVTNTVALWPAGVASAVAYRRELKREQGPKLWVLGLASFVGGIGGAVLLLRTPASTFVMLVPWLLLVASVVFTAGGAITKRLGRKEAAKESAAWLAIGAVVQLVISVYGGYFGGGMGIMMLAALSLLGMTNIHAMNAVKTVLGAIINGVGVVIFIADGAVAWGPGLVMIAGATLGGYAGAAMAQKIDPKWVKRFVMVVAWGLTVFFFARAYGRF